MRDFCVVVRSRQASPSNSRLVVGSRTSVKDSPSEVRQPLEHPTALNDEVPCRGLNEKLKATYSTTTPILKQRCSSSRFELAYGTAIQCTVFTASSNYHQFHYLKYNLQNNRLNDQWERDSTVGSDADSDNSNSSFFPEPVETIMQIMAFLKSLESWSNRGERSFHKSDFSVV